MVSCRRIFWRLTHFFNWRKIQKFFNKKRQRTKCADLAEVDLAEVEAAVPEDMDTDRTMATVMAVAMAMVMDVVMVTLWGFARPVYPTLVTVATVRTVKFAIRNQHDDNVCNKHDKNEACPEPCAFVTWG